MTRLTEKNVRSVEVSDLLLLKGETSYPRLKRKMTLNMHGELITYEQYQDNVVFSTEKYKYQDGRIVKKSLIDGDQKLLQLDTLAYTPDGNLSEKKTVMADGRVRMVESYTYSNDLISSHRLYTPTKAIKHIMYQYSWQGDSVLKVVMHDSVNDFMSTEWRHFDNSKHIMKLEHYHEIFGKTKAYERKYDGDQLVYEALYNAKNKIESERFLKYSKSHPIEELTHNFETDTKFIVSRKFNNHGKVIEESGRFENADKPDYRFIVKHNCKGLEKKIIRYKEDGNVDVIQKKKYNVKGLLVQEKHFSSTEHYYTINYKYTYH